MNCTESQALIDRRLDGELSVDDAIQLGEHFALCAECKTHYAELKAVCGVVKTIPARESSGEESVSVKTMAVLRKEAAATRPNLRQSGKWWRLSTLGAAAAIVIFVLVRHLTSTPHTATTEIATQQPAVNPAPVVNEKPAGVAPPSPTTQVVAAKKPEHFDARRVVNDLYDTSELSDAERNERELLRKLSIKGQAGSAAKELAPAQDERVLWSLAVAVRNPAVDAEVFKSVAELTPDLRLAPVYIAALDSTRNRKGALQLLRTISKKNLGIQQEPWLDWLNAERRTASSRSGT